MRNSILINYLLAIVLSGNISNIHGMIGIHVSKYGRIAHVYKASPAQSCGLKAGDVVLSAEGVKEIKYVDGPARSTAHLVVSRGGDVFEIDVPRIDRKEIHD